MVSERIVRCKLMSGEIEHFESRIAKVEDFIRHDKFEELVALVQQIQDSLRVVRDLSFFEKQKQRIEKFDKMIMGYVQGKERELVLETKYYRQNASAINRLITLEAYFGREKQLIDLIVESKLLKDFDYLINQTKENSDSISPYRQKLFCTFTTALLTLLTELPDFLA